MDKAKARKILKILKQYYPKAGITLTYSNNFELLISVMLSANTTDKQVNKVTPALFKKYKGKNEREEVENFANVNLKTLERQIKSIGLFRTKAKNIKRSSQIITKEFEGKVPRTMADLTSLPGVGRKTANVVLSQAFNISEGIAVDTHVKHLALKLKMTKNIYPEKIEKDLMVLFDKKDWKILTHLFIAHGRKKDKKVALLLGKV